MNDHMMTLFLAEGRQIQVPYDAELMELQVDGMGIRNPFRSPCGRFYVSPTQYGFKVDDFIGASQSYTLTLPNEDYMVLTTSDGHLPDEEGDAENAIMGRYTAEGEQLAQVRMANVPTQSELDDLEAPGPVLYVRQADLDHAQEAKSEISLCARYQPLNEYRVPLYTGAVQIGEPVAWVHPLYLKPGAIGFEASVTRLADAQVPLYTHPDAGEVERLEKQVARALNLDYERRQEIERLARKCQNADLALKAQTENCERLRAQHHRQLTIILDSLEAANCSAIIDTIWSTGSPSETLFDFIKAALGEEVERGCNKCGSLNVKACEAEGCWFEAPRPLTTSGCAKAEAQSYEHARFDAFHRQRMLDKGFDPQDVQSESDRTDSGDYVYAMAADAWPYWEARAALTTQIPASTHPAPAEQKGEPVTLPARKAITAHGLTALDSEAEGWNACLDELAKLGPLYTGAAEVPDSVLLLNLAEHALSEHSFNSVGDVVEHDQAFRDQVREKIEAALRQGDVPELCVDEGCPHHGTKHACVNLGRSTFKKGDIVRYGSGPSALIRLDTRHAGGWHGIHCLGGYTYTSNPTHATPEEVETYKQLRAETLARQGRTE